MLVSLHTLATNDIPVTPPARMGIPLQPPVLKGVSGPVIPYFDLDDNEFNPLVLSLSEDSFHTPNPRTS